MAPVSISDPLKAAIWPFILPLLTSLQIGALATWALQGVLVVQAYNYHVAFPRDPWHMKALVYATLVVQVAQTLLATVDTYYIFVTDFGNWATLDNLRLLWLTIPILGGIAGLLCHLTFAYRLSLLSESTLVGTVVAACSIFACVCSLVFGGKLHQAGRLSSAMTVHDVYLLCGLWNGVGAFTDCLIAATLSYYLTRSSNRFTQTDLLITRIIRLTIETGLATATASIASAILFIGFRDAQQVTTCIYFVVPAIMISKLYAITILATFNNRPHVVGVGSGSIISSANTGTQRMRSGSDYGRQEVQAKRGSSFVNMTHSGKISEIQIGTTVVTEVWSDTMDPPLDPFESLKYPKASTDSSFEGVNCDSQSVGDDMRRSTINSIE